MAIEIKDATGNGYGAKVTSEGQVNTVAEIHELQHHNARVEKKTFKIFSDNVITGDYTCMHLCNTSQSSIIVIDDIILEDVDLAGGTALPAVESYFCFLFDSTYTSGGTALTPINTNRVSGNVAPLDVYKGATVDSTSAVEFQRIYVKDGETYSVNEHGAIILGFNDTIEVRLVTDHSSGHYTVTMTVMEMDPEV